VNIQLSSSLVSAASVVIHNIVLHSPKYDNDINLKMKSQLFYYPPSFIVFCLFTFTFLRQPFQASIWKETMLTSEMYHTVEVRLSVFIKREANFGWSQVFVFRFNSKTLPLLKIKFTESTNKKKKKGENKCINDPM